MHPVTIHDRTFQFSVAILDLFPRGIVTDTLRVIRRQVIRSATSIGANVVEAQHASTKREFLQYMQIALRSSRETEYWLNLALASRMLGGAPIQSDLRENHEISKILASILLSGKSKHQ